MKARALAWGVAAVLATAISCYALLVLFVPGFGAPFVAQLRAQSPWAILTHITASLIALAIGPWQFNAWLRSRASSVHRWMGRVYVAAVVAGGGAALALAPTTQEGIVTHVGFALLALAWLASTLRAYHLIRAGDDIRHREWMIRSFALTLAAVTLRLILPFELAIGVSYRIGYQVVSWACWLPNLVVAEWLVRTRPRASQVKTAPIAIVLSAAASALLQAQAPPAWSDTFTSRVEALAVIQTLNAELLASRSSTATLETWCRDHRLASSPQVIADAVPGTPATPSAEQLQRLEVSQPSQVKYRHVRLRCGTTVLSEAENWYVPSRLSVEMNRTLETTDAPFGRVVSPLQPYRRTFSVTMLWSPLPPDWDRVELPADTPMRGSGALEIPAALLEHRAVLYTRDNRPFSEVREVYQRGVLAFPPPR